MSAGRIYLSSIPQGVVLLVLPLQNLNKIIGRPNVQTKYGIHF